MALIRCPECNNVISDKAEFCPHCGLSMKNIMVTNVLNYVAPVQAMQHEGYDVVFVDSAKSKLATIRVLQNVLNCGYLEASSIVSKSPCYIYTDLSYNDALYIAQSLQYYDVRTAVIDPYGNSYYFTPKNYNRTLPLLQNLFRKPFLMNYPSRTHEFVIKRQKINPAPQQKTTRNKMLMPTNRYEAEKQSPLKKQQTSGSSKPKMTVTSRPESKKSAGDFLRQTLSPSLTTPSKTAKQKNAEDKRTGKTGINGIAIKKK